MIKFDRSGFSDNELKDIYKQILLPRMIEEKMLILLRQGKISKWFSGYGQEAVSVGATLAMKKEEFILPMHRNLGVFTARELPLDRLFAQFQGKPHGFTNGRDRSFHFGAKDYNIVGMISHLGPQMGVADGIGLSDLLDKKESATLVVTGDGGASEGDFHESLNVAAVWNLPVIFMVENNSWGLSTPSKEQFNHNQFVDKAIGYGIEGVQVNGNNILEVIKTMKSVAEDIRKNPKPVIVEMMTFRMRGHEEASGTKYYPEGIQDEWSKKDPVNNFEHFLLETKVISQEEVDALRANIKEQINKGLEVATSAEEVSFNKEKELADLYAPFDFQEQKSTDKVEDMRFVDAISDGLKHAMVKHDNLVLMGQDIAEYGGVFKITDGFVSQFGKDRVRNTPLCESAILGTALGLSIKGKKAMMEMQFADFVSEGITQICNNLAKIHYRWGQNADVVVRMPTGAGVGAGPFHSQSNEAWFTHVPGLKIVYPAFPEDAKGLLLTAFEDPNPVMFFEHKALYRSLSGSVPTEYYNLPLGKAKVVTEGTGISVITYGMGVHWAMQMAEKHPEWNLEVIDLRTLAPLDYATIERSVEKTGKVLVLHEDTLFGGIGGEIAAYIGENCFEHLDAPVMRSGSLDIPVPFHPTLEAGFLANADLEEKLARLIAY